MKKIDRKVLGWREWVKLPELGAVPIKAKIDTGARTSALHIYFVEKIANTEPPRIRFGVHPVQGDDDTEIICEAEIIDERWVTDSGGNREMRPVIRTLLEIDGQSWPIELTLTSRASMRFRMLLGRTAIRKRCLVNPGRSYLASSKQENQ